MRQNLENSAKNDKRLQSEISRCINVAVSQYFVERAATLLNLHNGTSARMIHSHNDFDSDSI